MILKEAELWTLNWPEWNLSGLQRWEWLSCNNIALFYLTFWYLPPRNIKILKKIGDGYVIAAKTGHALKHWKIQDFQIGQRLNFAKWNVSHKLCTAEDIVFFKHSFSLVFLGWGGGVVILFDQCSCLVVVASFTNNVEMPLILLSYLVESRWLYPFFREQ